MITNIDLESSTGAPHVLHPFFSSWSSVVNAQEVLKRDEWDDPSPPDLGTRKYPGGYVLLNCPGRNANYVRGFGNVNCKLFGLRAHTRNIAHWRRKVHRDGKLSSDCEV
jgi:hypothetical protein